MAARKTHIAIDSSLLNRARDVLRTATPRETVEEALLLVLRARARRDEVEALSGMRGMGLDDDRVMAKAWRT
jgi:Arc/MetJ family transcription regulator